MSCQYKCHCGNELVDDNSTRRGYCYDCDGPEKQLAAVPSPMVSVKRELIEKARDAVDRYHCLTSKPSLNDLKEALMEALK